MQTITLKDMMAELWNGKECDLTYITCDLTRNKGGDIKEYKGVKLNLSNNTNSSLKDTEYQAKPKQQSVQLNIVLQSNEIRTIYIVGITKFNGKQVLR
jgi:hypothetical protein